MDGISGGKSGTYPTLPLYWTRSSPIHTPET